MAIKTVKYCSAPTGYNDKKALLVKSSQVRIKLSDKFTLDRVPNAKTFFDGIVPDGDDGWLYVVCNEPLSFNLGVSFENSAPASVANKLNELFNSKLIKALGGPLASNALPTDSWTREVVKEVNPISVNLKFRAFDHDMNRTTCNVKPTDLIKFLILVSSPPKPYDGLSAVLNPAIGAVRNISSLVNAVKDKYNTQEANWGEGHTEKVSIITSTLEAFVNQLDNSIKTARYNYTFFIGTDKMFNGGAKANPPDWILKSWTATPSVEVNSKDNAPLYVDFDLTFETNAPPSKEYLDNLLKV